MRITIEVPEIPEVEVVESGCIMVAGWGFDVETIPTAEDVAAFAVAKEYFEQHPELMPDE